MIELQEIAQNTKSTLSDVKEVFRVVNDLDLTRKIIKKADEHRICPYVVLIILKEFEVC